MALIKCEECGKEISDRADACPHCGCPISHVKPVTRNNFATACLFISHLLGFGYTLYCLIYWASASSGMSGFEKLPVRLQNRNIKVQKVLQHSKGLLM